MMGCIIKIYIYREYKMEHMIIDITNQLDIFQKGRLDPLAERKGMCVCLCG